MPVPEYCLAVATNATMAMTMAECHWPLQKLNTDSNLNCTFKFEYNPNAYQMSAEQFGFSQSNGHGSE